MWDPRIYQDLAVRWCHFASCWFLIFSWHSDCLECWSFFSCLGAFLHHLYYLIPPDRWWDILSNFSFWGDLNAANGKLLNAYISICCSHPKILLFSYLFPSPLSLESPRFFGNQFLRPILGNFSYDSFSFLSHHFGVSSLKSTIKVKPTLNICLHLY